MKKAYANSIKKVNDMVIAIVNEIAEDKKLQLVLPSSQVLFFDESIDITNQVIKKLNKKISKMKVSFN